MARIAGSNGAKTADAIRRAGLELIFEHGFEGFGLRELAQRVGLQPASLYNHIDSKQALLLDLISTHMAALTERTEALLAACHGGPRAELECFTANHLDCHIDRKLEVYVANFELRALVPDNLAFVLEQRRRYEGLLIAILDRLRDAGLMGVTDTHVAAYAVLAMLTGACTWYRPDGRLSKAAMIELHTQLVLNGCVRGVSAVSGPATTALGARSAGAVTSFPRTIRRAVAGDD